MVGGGRSPPSLGRGLGGIRWVVKALQVGGRLAGGKVAYSRAKNDLEMYF